MSSLPSSVLTRTVDLDNQQLLVIENRPGARVQVLLGGVWLTEERRLQDRFARAGTALELQTEGRAVVESLGRTRLRVTEPGPGALARRWPFLARQRQRIAGLVPRALAAMLALVLSLALPEILGRGVQSAQAREHAAAVSQVSPPSFIA
jgi:Protein of unknown function (DUF2917)